MVKQQRPDGDGAAGQFTQFTVCPSIAPALIRIAVAANSNGAMVIIWIVLDCVLTGNIVLLLNLTEDFSPHARPATSIR
jgi:hypothetical protein